MSTPNSSYVRFPEEQDPTYLGTAMEGATAISKLLFHWVNPLMEKGVHGLLNHSDDLFDLPESVSTGTIIQKIDKHLQTMVNSKFCYLCYFNNMNKYTYNCITYYSPET